MCKNEASLFRTPFSGGYWRCAFRELRSTRMLALTALFIALRVVLESFRIPLGDNLNIFFNYFVNGLGSAIYGPVLGLISGFCADILGYLLHPTGPFFPGYVLSTMLGSLVYALFFYRTRVSGVKIFCAKLVVNLGVNVGLGALWSSILYGKGYYYFLVKGLVKNLVLLPVETVLLFLFLRAMLPIVGKLGLIPKQEKVTLL